MEQFNTLVNDNLGWVHTNKIIFSLLVLIVIIYAAQVRPKLPSYVETLFENTIFKFVVIAYIVYLINHDKQLAIILSAAFLLTLHMVNKQQTEKLTNLKNKH